MTSARYVWKGDDDRTRRWYLCGVSPAHATSHRCERGDDPEGLVWLFAIVDRDPVAALAWCTEHYAREMRAETGIEGEEST